MNLYELMCKISLDTSEYEKGLSDAGEETSSLASKIGGGLASAAKIGGAALAAAGTAAAGAAVALGKSALDGYADYEQLVGGVETLFKDSAGVVQGYADIAFKTAGISANQYMETVTSFSASLLQSLNGDTAAAAQIADQAIIDMSDNANKMGSDMATIQSAYQGFAKGNYTLLDNLKLGYGGTKEEMERLIADANRVKEANGEMGDLSMDSFANIVEAIHIVQTEMDITGTTAKEASETIGGSIGSMKAAWENLVTGIANPNADIGALVGDFVSSVSAAAKNIIPAVQNIISGIGNLVAEILPVIVDAIPQLIPAALETINLFAQTILQALPQIVKAALQIVVSLAKGIAEALPTLVPTIVSVVMEIVEILTDPVTLSDLLFAAVAIIIALAEGIIKALPELLTRLPIIIANIVTTLVSMGPQLYSAGLELMFALGGALIGAIPTLINSAGDIVNSIQQAIEKSFSDFQQIGKNMIEGIWTGIQSMIGWLSQKAQDAIGGVVDGVKNFLGIRSPSTVFAGIGENMALGLGEGWEDEIGSIQRDINNSLVFGGSANGGASGRDGVGDIILNVTSVLDGAVLARQTYSYNKRESLLRGASLVGVNG